MSWDNTPNRAGRDFDALDRAEAEAERDEAYADLLAEQTYEQARLSVAEFEGVLFEQGELPTCYCTVGECEVIPEKLPKRELALAVIAQWHAQWLAGDSPMAKHLDAIVRTQCDYLRAKAFERGAPRQEADEPDFAEEY